jgi:predicted GNAT family acetyltransferase
MDRTLLERSPKADANLNRYGSIDNFLDKGLAVCILHSDDIVSEAYADMAIMGMREIGIRTKEAHRRRGLATSACAKLIKRKMKVNRNCVIASIFERDIHECRV